MIAWGDFTVPVVPRTVTVELAPDDAQDLYDWLLFRPHDERWSDDVIAALKAAGVRPSPAPEREVTP